MIDPGSTSTSPWARSPCSASSPRIAAACCWTVAPNGSVTNW